MKSRTCLLAFSFLAASAFQAAAQAPALQYLERLGFWEGSEFTSSYGSQRSFIHDISESGYAIGVSQRFDGVAVGGNYAALDRGYAAWVAQIGTGTSTRVGFFDGNEFTRSDGYQFSTVNFLSESGYFSGASRRYAGMADLGNAVWVASPGAGSYSRVGLFTGSEHTRNDGYQYSVVQAITGSGHLVGNSTRYDGAAGLGQAAWTAAADTGITTKTGFFSGAEFTRNDGYQYSAISGWTGNGRVSGTSFRYDGAESRGEAAWVAQAGISGAARAGFFSGGEFTRSDGFQFSRVADLTESGYLNGTSSRFDGANDFGTAAWVMEADSGTVTRIGFFSGPEFTRNDGYQESQTYDLTESGYVTGVSSRYNNGAENLGTAAWVANAATGLSVRVGLYNGSEHARSDGFQYSHAKYITNSGQVAGDSLIFTASEEINEAVWVADAVTGTTTRIGLFTGNEFVRSDGNQRSQLMGMAESGYVIGHSTSFQGETEGRAAWVAKAGSGVTTRLGLYDERHTMNGGRQSSEVSGVTESGYVWGNSEHADGFTAWIWNAAEEEQYNFELSVGENGSAHSYISGVREDGIALGGYWEFAETGLVIGEHAFIWSEEWGVVVLDDVLSEDILENGWKSFSELRFSSGDYLSEDGMILVGMGRLLNGSSDAQGVFVVQAVPEPSTYALMALGAVVLVFVLRKKTRRV